MKKLMAILIFVLISAVSVCAFSAPYTDSTYQYSIDIPEGENIYYYTKAGSNMLEDVLAATQAKQPPVSFMTAAYSDSKALVYSLDITVLPLKEALADPGLSGITDLSLLNADQLALLTQNKKAEYGADYTFVAEDNIMLAGKAAIVLTGHLTQTNGYTTKIYLLADNDQLFTITMLYKDDSSNAYLDQVAAVLSTLSFTDTPAAPQGSAAPTAAPTASAAPTNSVPATAAPSPSSASTNGFMGFISGIRDNLVNSYHNDPSFPLYVIGGCIIVALIIIVIILVRANRRKGRNVPNRSLQDLEAQLLTRRQDTPVEEAPAPPKPEAPYDSSKYTRQPRGYDADIIPEQKVSAPPVQAPKEPYATSPQRPTIAEAALQDTAQQTAAADQNRPASDPSRPKVGSRMDRHKKKKK